MNERLNAVVGAKIGEFRRKMAGVKESIGSLPNMTVVRVKAITKGANNKIDEFGRSMDNLATKIRTVGVIGGSMLKGGLLSALPALSPIIGSLAGGLGGLASSLVAAGGAFGAFGVAAAGNIGKLTKSSTELKSIKDKIKSEKQSLDPNQKKINELLNEQKSILKGLSKEQKSAMKQTNAFKKVWSNFLKVTEKPVFKVFAAGLKAASSLIKKIEPIVKPAADAITGLLKKFNSFSKTKQFKSFINFFATRGSSAIKSWGTIAGNILQGFMELMKAFGPLGKDMEKGLIGMTDKFAKWAAALKNSKAFNKFVNFVKTNGPKVLDLIGNLTTFIVELGKGMAPLGSKILNIVNGFLSWISGMMKAKPIIGQVIAWVTSLTGILIGIAPVIIGVKLAFGGMASFIWAKTGMMRAKLVTGVSMMIKSLGKFIAKMVATVAKFVAQSVIFIAKWALMGAKATFQAGKMAAAWTLATGKKLAVASAKMVATSATFVAKWALMGTKSALGAGKVAAAWALSTGKKLAVATSKMIATSATFVAKWAMVGAKSLLHAAKVAAAWFIALGPVGWVIATVIALVALIIANWDKVKKWTKKAWKATVKFVTNAWDKVWGKTKEIASAIWNWVKEKFNDVKNAIDGAMNKAKDIITNIWDKVKSVFNSVLDWLDSVTNGRFSNILNTVKQYMDMVWSNIKSVWSFVKDTFKNALDFVKSLLKGDFEGMWNAVKNQMGNIKDTISDIWDNVMGFFGDIDLAQTGKDIMQGLINGIGDMAGAIGRKIKEVAGGIKDKLMFWTDSHSPSRMTEKIGGYVGQGLVVGMNKMTGKVKKASENIASASVPKVNRMDVGLNTALSQGSNATISPDTSSVASTSNHSNTSNDNRTVNITVDAGNIDEVNKVVELFSGLKQAHKAY